MNRDAFSFFPASSRSISVRCSRQRTSARFRSSDCRYSSSRRTLLIRVSPSIKKAFRLHAMIVSCNRLLTSNKPRVGNLPDLPVRQLLLLGPAFLQARNDPGENSARESRQAQSPCESDSFPHRPASMSAWARTATRAPAGARSTLPLKFAAELPRAPLWSSRIDG